MFESSIHNKEFKISIDIFQRSDGVKTDTWFPDFQKRCSLWVQSDLFAIIAVKELLSRKKAFEILKFGCTSIDSMQNLRIARTFIRQCTGN